MRGFHVAIVVCAVAAFCGVISPALAQERYRRDWSDHPGMPRQIWDLTHDERGFLWLASEEGVHRFDGREVVPWGRDVVRTVIHSINRDPDGRLVAVAAGGSAYEVNADGLETVLGPDGAPFTDLQDADYAADGSLWLCTDDGLYRRTTDGWTTIDESALRGQMAIRVRGAPDGGAFVGTREGSFVRVYPDHTAETWASGLQGRVMRIAVKDAHTQAFSLRFGPNHGVYLVEGGQVRPVYQAAEVGRRWTGLVFREDTLWAVATGEVLRITDDWNQVEVLGPDQGFETGGSAVVDHEKSLWLTSFRGTYQFTEPDVVLWTEQFGTRRVHRVGSEILVGRWRGPQLRRQSGQWDDLTPDGYHIFDWGGVSPWGTFWFVAVQYPDTPRRRTALLEYRDGQWTHHLTRDFGVYTGAYATDESGALWIAYFNTLWCVPRDGEAPQAVATLAMETAIIKGLSVRDGRVSMAFRYGPFCEGTLNANRSALDGEWNCQTIDGAGELN
ncbi:MAG: hypothetical protein OEV00_10315, partial [Acidobacteriota bacterium]|nr:hypothetical protein [Acidobacteriota bacterium]